LKHLKLLIVKKMRIQNIINLLKTQKFYGVSKEVDIAKGINELTPNVKRIIDQENRKYHGRKESN
jgi:hypothetical protein